MAPFKEIDDSQAGAWSRNRSSTVITLLPPLSTPLSSTAVTRYCRWGTPLSWNVLEVVSPRIKGAAGRGTGVHAIAREIRVGDIVPEQQNPQRTIGIAARLELVGEVGRRGRAAAVAVHEGRLAGDGGQQNQGQEHTHKSLRRGDRPRSKHGSCPQRSRC